VAPPGSNASRPGRMLALLAGIIVVMILAVVGADLASPGKWSGNFRVHLGLDLTSGTTVALQAVKPGGGAPASAEMQQAIQIMTNRVNGAGFTEAQVEQQGSDVITVSVPGQSAERVVSQVSRTAELQLPSPAPGSATPAWQQARGDASLVSAPVKAQFNELNCAGKNWQQAAGYTKGQYTNPRIQIVSCDSSHNKFVLDKSDVAGDMIASASATPQTNSSTWQVNLNFNSDGAKAFGDLTTTMYDKYGTSNSPLDDLAVVAATVHIHLADEGRWLTFSVADDGHGYDPTTTATGSGTQNMTDRLSALGGSLNVRSTPGSGTTVTGRIPIAAGQPAPAGPPEAT
jgi:preprotein translocase subunit SecD